MHVLVDGSVFLGRIPRDCHPQRLTVGFHVRFRRLLQCAPALHDHLMASGEALVRAQPHPEFDLQTYEFSQVLRFSAASWQSALSLSTLSARCIGIDLARDHTEGCTYLLYGPTA